MFAYVLPCNVICIHSYEINPITIKKNKKKTSKPSDTLNALERPWWGPSGPQITVWQDILLRSHAIFNRVSHILACECLNSISTKRFQLNLSALLFFCTTYFLYIVSYLLNTLLARWPTELRVAGWSPTEEVSSAHWRRHQRGTLSGLSSSCRYFSALKEPPGG